MAKKKDTVVETPTVERDPYVVAIEERRAKQFGRTEELEAKTPEEATETTVVEDGTK